MVGLDLPVGEVAEAALGVTPSVEVIPLEVLSVVVVVVGSIMLISNEDAQLVLLQQPTSVLSRLSTKSRI